MPNLGSKNTRMAPKTHTTYVRISTQRMDTLHTIHWGEGIQPKINVEKIPPFNEVQVQLRMFSVLQFLERLFLNRLFCIEIFIFETSNHP